MVYTSSLQCIIVGKVEAGTLNSEAHHTTAKSGELNKCMHVSLLSGAQLAFPTLRQFRTAPSTYQPLGLRSGATHSGLGLPTLINVIKTIPQRYAHRQTSVDNPSSRFSSQLFLGCVWLTINFNYHAALG